MKGLTATQYGALVTLDRISGSGVIAYGARNADGQALLARGLVASEPRQCRACGRLHVEALVITTAGRTAMRCYELEHRALDLGVPS